MVKQASVSRANELAKDEAVPGETPLGAIITRPTNTKTNTNTNANANANVNANTNYYYYYY